MNKMTPKQSARDRNENSFLRQHMSLYALSFRNELSADLKAVLLAYHELFFEFPQFWIRE